MFVAGGGVVVSTVSVSPVEKTDESVKTDAVIPGADVVIAGAVVNVLSGRVFLVVTKE